MEKGKNSRDWFSLIVGLTVVLPILILFDVLGGDEGRGRAAAIAAGVIILAIRVTWELRYRLWYWAVLVLICIVHGVLILTVSWSNRYLSWVALLPFATLDGLVVYGVIRLVEKIANLFGRSDNQG